MRSSQLSVQLQEATSMHNAKVVIMIMVVVLIIITVFLYQMAAKDKEIEDLKYRVVEVD